MGIGDYVMVRQLIPIHARRGDRGTLVALAGDWATVQRPDGRSFPSHINNLSRLVTAEGNA